MEITANFDPDVILKHLDKIERQAEELRAALPEEMARWQEDDLNRKSPYSKTIDVERPTANFTRASTFINPTSRRRMKRRRRQIRWLKKAAPERIVKSNRPTLRATLLADFKARFLDLLNGAF
ncbi:MAG: hypothetical protein WCB99_03815 [Candidatus Cybelea sp.]